MALTQEQVYKGQDDSVERSPVSIFGFEPLASSPDTTLGSPCPIRTQRSLLSLLLKTPNSDDMNDDEDSEYYVDDDAESDCDPTEQACCSEVMRCEASSQAPVSPASPVSQPIAIPNTTYYKNEAFRAEKERLQYQRQLYRQQLEAQAKRAQQLQAQEGFC